MRSLSTFKRLVTRLQKQVESAKTIVAECEFKANGNPCSLTFSALDRAYFKLEELNMALENAEEMVTHYDFYKYCYEQEEKQAMLREYYLNR